jgi:WD40 repeat protein/tRNA A-37 threonylcarbamoyl transferase component Bud32
LVKRSKEELAAELPAVAGYEILGVLGRGAMGVVYKARHTRLNRLVALKMILAGTHADRGQRQRFRVEAEAVARLQHPHIVQIHEIGEQDGRPYFALEYLEGGTLAGRVKDLTLSGPEAARVVEILARAIQAAHQKGVVHRDLKPGNVLVAGGPDLPLPQCTLKVADFGLARLMDVDSRQTGSGAVMGTPSYMAPEQAEGKSREVGPAADIYALGAILYDLLTGRPPFKAETPIDTLLQVISQEPAPPTRLNAKIPRDLETVCLKCLRKEPARRYGSAEALAEDLHRYLAGEPILARPVGRLERLAKWARRRPAAAALAAVSILAAAGLLSLGGALWANAEQRAGLVQDLGAAREELGEVRQQKGVAEQEVGGLRQEAAAKRVEVQGLQQDVGKAHTELAQANLAAAASRERARTFGYIGDMRLVQADWETNRVARVLDTLRRHLPRPGEDDLRGFEWFHYWHLAHGHRVLGRHPAPVDCVAVSPEGKTVAAGGRDKTLRLWSVGDAKPTGSYARADWSWVNSVAFSPDGRSLAAASRLGAVCVFDLANKQPPVVLPLPNPQTDKAWCLAYAPDGRTLAVGYTDRKVGLWDPVEGKRLGDPLEAHVPNPVLCLAYSRDGSTLATGSLTRQQDLTVGELKLWDVATRKEEATLVGHTHSITSLAFSPDGTMIATGSGDQTVKLWDVKSRKEKRTLQGHRGRVTSVAFSHNGKVVASGSEDTTLKTWDRDTGRELATLRGHTEAVNALAFLPDDRGLVSAGLDREVKWWDLAHPADRPPLQAHNRNQVVWAAAFSPDSQTLATASADGTAKLWQAADPGAEPVLLRGHAGAVMCLTFAPGGKQIATGGEDRKIHLWDPATGQLRKALEGHRQRVIFLAYSAEGKALASVSLDNTVRVWEVESDKAQELSIDNPRCAVFTPDGQSLVIGCMNGRVRVWDLQRQGERQSWQGHSGEVRTVALSPDGKSLATGGNDATAKLWELGTGRLLWELKGHQVQVRSVAFTPDGRTLVTAAGDVKLWDVATGQERATFAVGKTAFSVAVAPDHGRLAAGCLDGSVLLWDGPRNAPKDGAGK